MGLSKNDAIIMLERIQQRLSGIASDELTTAERQILGIVEKGLRLAAPEATDSYCRCAKGSKFVNKHCLAVTH